MHKTHQIMFQNVLVYTQLYLDMIDVGVTIDIWDFVIVVNRCECESDTEASMRLDRYDPPIQGYLCIMCCFWIPQPFFNLSEGCFPICLRIFYKKYQNVPDV